MFAASLASFSTSWAEGLCLDLLHDSDEKLTKVGLVRQKTSESSYEIYRHGRELSLFKISENCLQPSCIFNAGLAQVHLMGTKVWLQFDVITTASLPYNKLYGAGTLGYTVFIQFKNDSKYGKGVSVWEMDSNRVSKTIRKCLVTN